MLADATLFAHWWQYYFVPLHEVWWKGAVWGNVFALIPTAFLAVPVAVSAYFWHKGVVTKLEISAKRHERHSKLLDDIVGMLDPEIDANELHAKVDRISDLVDDTTPGGITKIIEELHAHK